MAEYVMAAQQGKLKPPSTSGGEPKLSKQKSLEVFKISQDLTAQQMERMKSQQFNETGDQMEMMTRMMVEQAKMQDEMFTKTGVENDEFEESLLYWVSKDPEVQQEMQKYMMKMRSQMGGMMPGM